MTNEKPPKEEIREYLNSLCAGDDDGLVIKLITIKGKKEFKEHLTKITGTDCSTISNAVNFALNFTVPPTQGNDQGYVINEIIERLSKYLKVKFV